MKKKAALSATKKYVPEFEQALQNINKVKVQYTEEQTEQQPQLRKKKSPDRKSMPFKKEAQPKLVLKPPPKAEQKVYKLDQPAKKQARTENPVPAPNQAKLDSKKPPPKTVQPKMKSYKKESTPQQSQEHQYFEEATRIHQPIGVQYAATNETVGAKITLGCEQYSKEGQKLEQQLQAFKQKLQGKKVFVIKKEAITISKTMIGKGGFGVVYKGRYKHTEVAIKYFALYPDELGLLEQEIGLNTNLRHPRVIQLFGVCLDIEMGHFVCLLVMELMEGDLEQNLALHPPSEEQKRRLVAQLAEGLSFIHGEKIIHRDIKLKNLLVDSLGNIKISDMGISLLLQNKEKTSGKTVAFTPQYVSPETALEEVTSFASDIWAMGIVVYEVVTGRRAWADKKLNGIIVALSRRENPFRSYPIQQAMVDFPGLKKELRLAEDCTNYDCELRPTIEQAIRMIA